MRDGTATKQKLERCALDLFVKKGVNATTIKDIANAAQVAEGTLYRHYTSKDDLAAALYTQAYKEFSVMLQAIIEQNISLKEKLKQICFLVCEEYERDPVVFNYLLIAQHHQLPKINQEDYSLHRILCNMFITAIKKGELTNEDPNYYAAISMGILIQSATFRVYNRIRTPLTQDAEKLSTVLERALNL